MVVISKTRKVLILFGLPLLIAILLLFWWNNQPKHDIDAVQAVNNPIPVHTAVVINKDVPIRIQGLGTVAAWHSVVIRSRVDGQLDQVLFTEGTDVKQGQVLFKLDDKIQQAQLAQAQAQKTKNQALLNNALADLKRYQALAKSAAIEKQVLDTQVAAVAALRADLLADEANINYAQAQLAYTNILAPISGRTGSVLVDPGNQLRANDTDGMVIINQIDPIAVNFTVPDTVFSQVQQAAQNEKTTVQVFNRLDNTLLAQGDLVLAENQINMASATLGLKARFANAEHKLWPGLSVDVRLILGDMPDALVVPDGAVQRGANGLYVYVVESDNTVRVQNVNTILSQDGLTVIGNGLESGQVVVTDGQYKLRPGLTVTEAES